MADDPPQNHLHRYWHKKLPDAPAPAEDLTLGMLSSRLVSFSCCHSPSRSTCVDLFVWPGAPPQLNAGAPAAPTDESTQGILTLCCLTSVRLPAATPPSLVSFNCYSFICSGSPAEIRLRQLDVVGVPPAPPDGSATRRINKRCSYPSIVSSSHCQSPV